MNIIAEHLTLCKLSGVKPMDDLCTTRVIFKLEQGSKTDVIAFLLDVPSNYGSVVCYAHIGQHSEASLEYARGCKPASPNLYSELKQELESLGYVL